MKDEYYTLAGLTTPESIIDYTCNALEQEELNDASSSLRGFGKNLDELSFSDVLGRCLTELRSANTQHEINEKEKIAREEFDSKNELGRTKFEEIFPDFNTADDKMDYMNIECVVKPFPRGMCDTLGAEIVRAFVQVYHRYMNDGDLFYEDYGWETSGSSAAFLVDKLEGLAESNEYATSLKDGKELSGRFMKIAEKGLEDDDYRKELDAASEGLVAFLASNPYLFLEANDTDSRDYDSPTLEDLKDVAPKYEYSLDLSGDLERYVDNECISMEDIESAVDDWCQQFGGKIGSRFAYDDYEFPIQELSHEELHRWENAFSYSGWSAIKKNPVQRWLDELEKEFPNFGEEEELDEDELDEDDMDR